MEQELFNVVQFFVDGSHEYVQRAVTAEEAMQAAHRCAHNLGALLGTTARVIITDMLDMTCLEWVNGEGVTFPEHTVH